MTQAAADEVKGAGPGDAFFRWIGEPRLLAAAFAATTMAYLPSLTLPWAISGLVSRLGLSTTAAGSLVTLQLAVLSAAAIGMGFVVDRLPKRAAAMFGAVPTTSQPSSPSMSAVNGPTTGESSTTRMRRPFRSPCPVERPWVLVDESRDDIAV